MIKLIECPRDAMQGLERFIPTELKVEYVNQLLKVGFHTIDFGSFVSAKAIPQMADTKDVLNKLDLGNKKSKLLAIVANTRGGEEASAFDAIGYLGFPLSISETFQQRNTNKSITEALNTINELKEICDKKNKELVVYLSMGFGNPYKDPYSPEIVMQFAGILKSIGIKIISLADTIGVATPEAIQDLFNILSKQHSDIEFGVHLHSHPATAKEKIIAALEAGCKRFDGALLGFGGCPMAEDELVGNIDTVTILASLTERGIDSGIERQEFRKALEIAGRVFSS